ncbi:MAG: hypothetical protein WD492_16665 [Alkalispirochaeta sp.]
MVYRLAAESQYGKPDYNRRNESIRSDILGGEDTSISSFLTTKA